MSDGSHFDPGSEAELERLQLQALGLSKNSRAD